MLQPRITNGQIINWIRFCDAIKIIIPTVAEELCKIEVAINPTRIAINGLLKELKNSFTTGDKIGLSISSTAAATISRSAGTNAYLNIVRIS